MKKILFVLFTLFTLTSCGGDDSPIDEPIDPEQPDGKIEVQLSDVTLSLKIGEEKHHLTVLLFFHLVALDQ